MEQSGQRHLGGICEAITYRNQRAIAIAIAAELAASQMMGYPAYTTVACLLPSPYVHRSHSRLPHTATDLVGGIHAVCRPMPGHSSIGHLGWELRLRGGLRRRYHDRAADYVIPRHPLQVALDAADGRRPAPPHRHGEAPLLVHPVEPQRRGPHHHGHGPAGHVHHGPVHGAGLPDIGHGAADGDRAGQQLHHQRRVVELRLGDGLQPLAAAGDAAPRYLLHAAVPDAQAAEVGDVVAGAEVVHQPRVHGAGRVHVPGAHAVEARPPVLLVLDGHARVVRRVRRRHDRRLHRRGGPARVQALDDGRDPAQVRRRHGRPGLHEEGQAHVVRELRVHLAGRPRRQDVHAGPRDVRLQDARARPVGPARREEGHGRRRGRPHHRAPERDGRRGPGRRPGVRRDPRPRGVAHVRRGQHVRVGEGGVPLRRLVHQDHAGAAVRGHRLPLLDVLADGAALAQHHLAPHLGLHQRAAVAGLREDERQRAPRGVVPGLEQRLAVELLPVAEPHGCAYRAVRGARRDREHPRRAVGDGPRGGAVVAGRGADEDAVLHGLERGDGDEVVVELRAVGGADGEGEHVHAVPDGGVQAGDDVQDGAPAPRAHLVDGQVRVRRHPGRPAVRVAPHAGVLRVVDGRAPERARADDLVAAPAAGDGPELAGALPLLGRRWHPRVAEGRVGGQDAGVEEPNHDAAAEPGSAPEAVLAHVEAEEARRVGGSQRQELLRVQPQAPLLAPQRLRLRVSEAGGEPRQHVAVRVDDPGPVIRRRVQRGLRQERPVPLLHRPAAAVVVPRLEMNHVVLALLRVGDGEQRGGQQQEEGKEVSLGPHEAMQCRTGPGEGDS
ncbi:Hydroxymethylglutaryl-CoA synthase [Zea mays]|uniref:Hydroxymethylglutaryl-CoA synthase n=1 Tax=Zea mays TaxID=4577 RepID=A0A1D6PL11_MAIZE|nr:Hydroxymethylglutaryl-CoA synthase [Zea mays]